MQTIIIVIAIAIILIIILFLIIKKIIVLAINSIIGIFALIGWNLLFSPAIPVNFWSVASVAVGGVIGFAFLLLKYVIL